MSLTTIKVDTAVRDMISAAARERGQTIGEYLELTVKEARRRDRLKAMADAMKVNPPGPDYWAEVAELDALTAVPVTEPARPQTGDVYWVRPDAAVGREQAGRRPFIVVASSTYLELVDTLALAVPISTVDRKWPNHVPVALPGLTGFAMTEQLRAASRDRFDGYLGRLDETTVADLREWLADYLGF